MDIFKSPYIKGDGTYRLSTSTGNSVVLALSDNFGGGTVTPGYINAAGNFIGFKDETETLITFSAEFQIVQDCGIGCKVAVLVAGSTGPNIVIDQFQTGR
ncbi:hypothetical protein KAR91_82360 [Candidatus Pacearchaeota archaeon]|nr:hypothetical protein [Candidatus Pacearchaeota archaeon]